MILSQPARSGGDSCQRSGLRLTVAVSEQRSCRRGPDLAGCPRADRRVQPDAVGSVSAWLMRARRDSDTHWPAVALASLAVLLVTNWRYVYSDGVDLAPG